MPLLLRKLEKKRHWDLSDLAWLDATAAPADALRDFQTDNHTLSVFLVASDESDLGRVIAACALTRDYVTEFDFALLEYGAFQALGLRETVAPGDTPDEAVNGLHLNIEELSAGDVALLAGAIRAEGKIRRYLPKKVREAIEISLNGGCVTIPKIREKMRTKLIESGMLP